MVRRLLECGGWAVCLAVLGTALPGCPWDWEYRLTIGAAPAGAGAVTLHPEAENYPAGSVVTVSAAAGAGWRFDHWEGPVAAANVPVTCVTMEGPRTLTAHFAPAPAPGEASISLAVGDAGSVLETAEVAIAGGSRLDMGEEVHLGRPDNPLADGTVEVVLRDLPVSGQTPSAFLNWLWVFEVSAEQGEEPVEVLFSTLNGASAVEPDFVSEGALLSLPLGEYGCSEGTPVELYRMAAETPGTTENGRRVAGAVVDAAGMAVFSLRETGRYAVGARPMSTAPGQADLGVAPLYDCVVTAEAAINQVKVIEESTTELFNAWVFSDIAPGQMPETTQWVVRLGDEPCMGRLEEYGRRFRVRSPYANAFVAEYGLQGQKQGRAAMSGPYEVDGQGEPAASPLEHPYEQCARIFAAEVKVIVLSRAGDYASFKSEVLVPLRAAFDTGAEISSNVRVSWFKALNAGYYAELWVHTEICTPGVAEALPMLNEEGVSVARMRGRLIHIIDWRGGGPYVAVHTKVAHNTGLGIRFFDPYWELTGGIVDEHALGGPENLILKLVDMEYDAIHDTLWVIMADEDGVFNLFRYDKPIYRFGDRPPDARIDFPTFSLRQLCVDPEADRLFVHTSGSPEEDGDGLRVFGYASRTPRLENRVTHVSFLYPNESEPRMLLFDHMISMGNTLYLVNGVSGDDDRLSVFSYPLTNGDFGARFKAWASFGAERSAPITKGVFSRWNNILYTATDADWNVDTSIYAIDAPPSWQSQWIVTGLPGEGYWTVAPARYRVLRWENPGSVWDLDVVEGDQELLAVAHAPALNEGEILLFENANTAAGFLTPIFRLTLTHGNQLVELINPPAPAPEG